MVFIATEDFITIDGSNYVISDCRKCFAIELSINCDQISDYLKIPLLHTYTQYVHTGNNYSGKVSYC